MGGQQAAGVPEIGAPFESGPDGLELEGVLLAELARALDGLPAMAVSHAAVARVAQAGARCVDLSEIGPLEVLGVLAGAGWWARVRSGHELELAERAGFARAQTVAAGGVRDDGFVKDALAAGVGAMEHAGAAERENVARIAALLGDPLPPEAALPPAASAADLDPCGGVLAAVLHGPPRVALDVAFGFRDGRSAVGSVSGAGSSTESDTASVLEREAVLVVPLEASSESERWITGTVEGLGGSGVAAPCLAPDALAPNALARGNWVLVPQRLACALRPPDPSYRPLDVVLVRDGLWRLLDARPFPAA